MGKCVFEKQTYLSRHAGYTVCTNPNVKSKKCIHAACPLRRKDNSDDMIPLRIQQSKPRRKPVDSLGVTLAGSDSMTSAKRGANALDAFFLGALDQTPWVWDEEQDEPDDI